MGAQNVSTPGPRYLRLAEASELCSTASETLRHWIWEGKLRSYKPGRHVLLREDELRAHIEAHETRTLRAAR